MIKKEACVETLQEAIIAYQNGADRLELCSRLDLDGLSPNVGLVKQVAEAVPIPLRIMIRSRGGSFTFSEREKKEMETQIHLLKSEKIKNVEGIVIGLLHDDFTIDLEGTRHLAKAAFPLKVVFHKAMDLTPDIFGAFAELADIQEVSSVLTSGGQPTAEEGSIVLSKLVKEFGKRFEIISAGRITPLNLNHLHEKIDGRWYHGRRIVSTKKIKS